MSTGEISPARYVQLDQLILCRTDITAAAKLVWAVLRDREGDNAQAWPSYERIAADCGLSRSTAIRAVRELCGAGLLYVDRSDRGRANRYRTAQGQAGADLRQLGEASSIKMTLPPVSKWNYQWCQNGTTGGVKMKPEPTPIEPTPPVSPPNRGGVGGGTHTRQRRSKSRAHPRPAPWDLATAAMQTAELKTERFRAAWEAWNGYHLERGRVLTESSTRRQISMLEKLGHEAAIATIEYTIERGWNGLVVPASQRGAQRRSLRDCEIREEPRPIPIYRG